MAFLHWEIADDDARVLALYGRAEMSGRSENEEVRSQNEEVRTKKDESCRFRVSFFLLTLQFLICFTLPGRSAPFAVCRCNRRRPTSTRCRSRWRRCRLRGVHCRWLSFRQTAGVLRRRSWAH